MGISHTLHFILNHPMNRGRPVSALARFAKWQLQSRFQEEIVHDWIEGSKLVVRRGMTGATGNIYCGLHEYVEMRFVLDVLRPEDLFVDIGANVGSYTVLASKVCGARTVAIEPDPGAINSLRRNIEVNGIGSKVEVVEAALSSVSGTVPFTVGRDTVNRVAKPRDQNIREVAALRLDDILRGQVPKVIKVDVEGYEPEVFKGAAATLADQRLEAIITESLDGGVLDVLEREGFRQVYYDPEKRVFRDSAVTQSQNFLMVRGSVAQRNSLKNSSTISFFSARPIP